MENTLNWKINISPFFSATLLLFSFSSTAVELIPIQQASQQGSANEHTQEEDNAKIRTHHLRRMVEKMMVDPKNLEEKCKYESEISTRPPINHVAFTFDDGPEPGQTEFILDVLKKYNLSATFFLIGQKMQAHPELVEKIRAADQQLIGNHSWDHPNFHDIGVMEQATEIIRDDDFFANSPQPKLFRYPYGNSTCETNALAHAKGYKIVGWHIDSCDWAFDKTGKVDFKEALSCGVLPQFENDYVGHVISAVRARRGGIILMHEIHPNTIRKLEEIITKLKEDGFLFGTVLDENFRESMR